MNSKWLKPTQKFVKIPLIARHHSIDHSLRLIKVFLRHLGTRHSAYSTYYISLNM